MSLQLPPEDNNKFQSGSCNGNCCWSTAATQVLKNSHRGVLTQQLHGSRRLANGSYAIGDMWDSGCIASPKNAATFL